MRLFTLFSAAFAVTALVQLSSSAQETSVPKAIGRAKTLITIALAEPVQFEIGLQSDSAEIRKLLVAMEKEIQDKTGHSSPDKAVEVQEILAQIDSTYYAELKKKLRPEQFTRLQQIHWQFSGSRVMIEPEIVESLKISDDQLKKLGAWLNEIERIQKSFSEKLQAAQKQQQEAAAKGEGLEESQTRMRNIADQWKKETAEHQKSFNQILTKKQFDKFAELKGKPFVPQARPRQSIEVGGLMSLALMEPVQKELGIAKDSDVIPEIRKLLETARSEFFEITKRPGSIAVSNPQEVESELRSKYDPELAKLLTTEQYTRLQQIYWQKSEGRVFNNPDVIKLLKITTEQQAQLAALNAQIAEKLVRMMNDGNRKAGDVQQVKQQLMAEREKRFREIFTEEQQAKIKEQKGEPFDLTPLQPQAGKLQ